MITRINPPELGSPPGYSQLYGPDFLIEIEPIAAA
ncbi:hypothetical protein V1293_001609 [Bradyrhizobium sp. AZCC 1693]